jgi:hypothetical protein
LVLVSVSKCVGTNICKGRIFLSALHIYYSPETLHVLVSASDLDQIG